MTMTSYWGCQTAPQPPGTIVGPTAYFHCPPTYIPGCNTAVLNCGAQAGGGQQPTTTQPQNVTFPPFCDITNITPICSTGIPIVCHGAAAAPQGGTQSQAQTLGPTAYQHCASGIPGCHTSVQGCTAPQPQNVTFTPICQITNITPVCSTGIPVVCNGAAAAPQGGVQSQAQTLGPTAYQHCASGIPGCHTSVQGCTAPQPQNVTFTPICQITNITPVCSTGIPIVCNGAAAAPQGGDQQQQQNLTFTPICQVTNIPVVCSTGIPVVCNGAAAAPQAGNQQQQQNLTFTPICQVTNIPVVCYTGSPVVCNGAAAAPQAGNQQQQQNLTFTPICQVTNIPVVCSTGIPVVCNGAAAAPQATVTPPTSIGCGTLATVCNPTHMHCTGPGAAQPQNVTIAPICEITNIPVICSTGIPIVCHGAAAAPQATVTPPTSIGCGTLATVCNPTHMHCTG